jgi:hypothetical protein
MAAAVSIGIRLWHPPATGLRQTSSPGTSGRSRSSTITWQPGDAGGVKGLLEGRPEIAELVATATANRRSALLGSGR